MRLCEFQQKEVINACDCKKLGYVSDLVFNECSGCIEAIIVLRGGRFCSWFIGGGDICIPFECICKIGPDIILVEIRDDKKHPR